MSVNDVYYVTSRCPYKLCSRVFQSRVFSRPVQSDVTDTFVCAHSTLFSYIHW